MNTLEKAAREYAGIKPDVFIDSEERYYNSHACENYDAFKAGAEWMQKTMINKATQWITEHIDIPYEGEFVDDSPVASDYIEWCEKRLEYAKAIADAFKQAMEE